MRPRLVGLLVLLCVVRAGAQQPPPTRQPTEPLQKCSIEGQVVKATTGEPLKKAALTLRKAEGREPPLSATTDAAGHFLLKDIDPGRYRFYVSRSGYVRQEYGQRAPDRPGSILTLEAGRRLRDVVFRMVQAAVITGRVFDEDGEPVPDVRIQALRFTYWGGKRQLVPMQMSNSNDLGEFRLHGLAPGRYYLCATLPNPQGFGGEAALPTTTSSREEVGYAPSYYPGTSDPARAGALELHSGEEVARIDFALLPTRAVRVRGRVLNAITGQPGRGTMIRLMPRNGLVRSFTFAFRSPTQVEDPQGNFEIRGVTPGSYLVTAVWYEDNKNYLANLPIEVGNSDVEGANLVISPGSDLVGRIQIKGRSEVQIPDLRVSLTPVEDEPFGGAFGPVKADGSFQLLNVADGTYRVRLWQLPPDSYLKEMRLGGEEVAGDEIVVNRSKARGSLEILLSPAGGRIEGLVLNEDDLPVSGALVALVPDAARRTRQVLYQSASTDQFGKFILRGIAPGEYKLFAWEEVEIEAYRDPEYLRPYEEKGRTVVLRDGERQTAELKLIPAKKPGT